MRGHKCPVPTLRLRRLVETLSTPFEITLMADDPMARLDIPHFCLNNGLDWQEISMADHDPLSIFCVQITKSF